MEDSLLVSNSWRILGSFTQEILLKMPMRKTIRISILYDYILTIYKAHIFSSHVCLPNGDHCAKDLLTAPDWILAMSFSRPDSKELVLGGMSSVLCIECIIDATSGICHQVVFLLHLWCVQAWGPMPFLIKGLSLELMFNNTSLVYGHLQTTGIHWPTTS